MKILIDTNIIIYREKEKILNESVMNLYSWINKLGYQIFIHPESKIELNKNKNIKERDSILTKLNSYTEIKSQILPDNDFLYKIRNLNTKENDKIDNILLYYVYMGRMDIFITEDKKLLQKAEILKIRNKVFNISEFIKKCTSEHPEFKIYKSLNVKTQLFGDCDLNDPFFDSLRSDYRGFDNWFQKKSEEKCYVCYSDKDLIQGFLYLKVEDENESYNDMSKPFQKCKRLKIGTFKVNSTGYRLGERFIKIIFDNVLIFGVNEIYVTFYENREEIRVLRSFFEKWGFEFYCKKGLKKDKKESVLIKRINHYNYGKSVKQNYPLINYNVNKYILPIYATFHKMIFPDAEKEKSEFNQLACSYALEKVYISWAQQKVNIKTGDIIFFYRTDPNSNNKKLTSGLTGYGIVTDVKSDFKVKEEFLDFCKNKSVFTTEQLIEFWKENRSMYVISFIYVREFNDIISLDKLRYLKICDCNSGPRPFTLLKEKQFKQIKDYLKAEREDVF